ncbi:hypothetical protein Fmac_026061 [Flemingia macrophylla]|uniref:Gnk2-homologous domain-containing protein n=1 Tax=Flemingia macrophylla TaxID=520843 RepID=A0ABD1LDV1_9FABA
MVGDPSLLKPLLASSVSDSSQKPFAAATQNPITAAYQCRGDLSNAYCRACVAKIPAMLPALCGVDVAVARVQLASCYLRYQAVGFGQAPATQLLYKACGSRWRRTAAGCSTRGATRASTCWRSAKAVWEMLTGIVLGVPRNRLRRPRESRGGRSGRRGWRRRWGGRGGRGRGLSSSVKFHQSAPGNVPLMPPWRRRKFDDDRDAVQDEEMLPPDNRFCIN